MYVKLKKSIKFHTQKLILIIVCKMAAIFLSPEKKC